MNPPAMRDFSTLTQWIDYAAGDAGIRAGISMFIGVDEIENDKFDVSAMFLESNRLFEPLFEAVYGTDEMARLSIPVEQVISSELHEPPNHSLEAMSDDFSNGLRDAHLLLGTNHDANVRAFLASLATKRFVILTGLSGSGKTQLALRFGDWIGIDRVRVTPVRPDWTGAEALFGYEDVLQPLRDGARAWHVPDALEFLLRAANDPEQPYLLVLDEMNLAHVERYFADFLSGMETGQACLPNLGRGDDGHYRLIPEADPKLPMPTNLFVIGTVNIDETTYLFSPKVLDRANTIDFRVRTEDLDIEYRKPQPCKAAPSSLVRGFLEVSADERFHLENRAPGHEEFVAVLRGLHRILSEHNLEFGHRVFYEATRFAAMFAASGVRDPYAALDRQIMQKILPRLHGSRRKLELALCALAVECVRSEDESRSNLSASRFDPLANPSFSTRMPLSFEKIQRMVRALRLNQFTSFSE
jgi:5-methylcytosine-specific restriction enzyme B